jgi:flagellar protein FlgJ
MNTTEYGGGGEGPNITRADFSANNNLSDSFNQHRQLLSNLPRYQSVLNAANPTDAFNALQKSGYATDPNYSSKLNNVFSKYVQPLYY